MLNPMDLTGKHILVTGASRGIGRAVCIVASKLGAHVSMAARSEEGLKETYSMLDQAAGGAFYSCDLSNEDEVERLVRDCVGQYGLLDGLVHCAGIPMTVPLKMCNWDKANQLMNINYLPFITFSRMLGNKRFGNSGASIVGISSVAALHGDKVQGLYSATKASLV